MEKKTKESDDDTMLDLSIIAVLSHKIIESLDLTGKEDCDKAALAAHALFLVSAHYLVETDPARVGMYLRLSIEFLSNMLDKEDIKEINNIIEKCKKRRRKVDGRSASSK